MSNTKFEQFFACVNAGDFDAALQMFSEIEEEKSAIYADVLHTAGLVLYFQKGQKPEGFALWERSLVLSRDLAYQKGIVRCLTSIGAKHRVNKQFEKAGPALEEALKAAQEIDDPKLVVDVAGQLIHFRTQAEGAAPEAFFKMYDNLVQYALRLEDAGSQTDVFTNAADSASICYQRQKGIKKIWQDFLAFLGLGYRAKAQRFFNEAAKKIALLTPSQDPIFKKMWFCLRYGQWLVLINKFAEARIYIQHSLEIAESRNQADCLEQAREALAALGVAE
jgi:tetratricopeptide (TPR) repeat protein